MNDDLPDWASDYWDDPEYKAAGDHDLVSGDNGVRAIRTDAVSLLDMLEIEEQADRKRAINDDDIIRREDVEYVLEDMFDRQFNTANPLLVNDSLYREIKDATDQGQFRRKPYDDTRPEVILRFPDQDTVQKRTVVPASHSELHDFINGDPLHMGEHWQEVKASLFSYDDALLPHFDEHADDLDQTYEEAYLIYGDTAHLHQPATEGPHTDHDFSRDSDLTVIETDELYAEVSKRNSASYQIIAELDETAVSGGLGPGLTHEDDGLYLVRNGDRYGPVPLPDAVDQDWEPELRNTANGIYTIDIEPP